MRGSFVTRIRQVVLALALRFGACALSMKCEWKRECASEYVCVCVWLNIKTHTQTYSTLL